MAYEIVIAGVGGQGVVFMSKLIAAAAEGEVKLIAHKGHAKREGSVDVHLKIGKSYSPVINPGEADLVIGLEPLEALRNAHLAKDNAFFLVESRRVIPVSCSLGEAEYPDNVGERLKSLSKNVRLVRFFDESDPRNFNIVMLGAASVVPGFPVPAQNLKRAVYEKGKGMVNYFDKGAEKMRGLL